MKLFEYICIPSTDKFPNEPKYPWKIREVHVQNARKNMKDKKKKASKMTAYPWTRRF